MKSKFFSPKLNPTKSVFVAFYAQAFLSKCGHISRAMNFEFVTYSYLNGLLISYDYIQTYKITTTNIFNINRKYMDSILFHHMNVCGNYKLLTFMKPVDLMQVDT